MKAITSLIIGLLFSSIFVYGLSTSESARFSPFEESEISSEVLNWVRLNAGNVVLVQPVKPFKQLSINDVKSLSDEKLKEILKSPHNAPQLRAIINYFKGKQKFGYRMAAMKKESKYGKIYRKSTLFKRVRAKEGKQEEQKPLITDVDVDKIIAKCGRFTTFYNSFTGSNEQIAKFLKTEESKKELKYLINPAIKYNKHLKNCM